MVLDLAKFNVCPYLLSGPDRAGILCVPYRADFAAGVCLNCRQYGVVDDHIFPISGMAEIL
jgi:hypothetical protein